MEYYAKSPNAQGNQPTVKEHLQRVAEFAQMYGEPLKLGEVTIMINLRQWNGISQIFLYRTERKWIFHQNPFPRDSSYQKRRYPDLRRNADIADTENSSISMKRHL